MVRSQATSGMTIGALARAGGVGVETVRFYQRRGLLALPAKPGGAGSSGSVRRYGSDDLRRLRFIRSAQAAGFALREIAELMMLDAKDDRARAHALAETRITALDATIAEMVDARARLQRLATACAVTGDGPCPILSAFDR